jgi:hypothetical protein
MAATSSQLTRLGKDPTFQDRVMSLSIQYATAVVYIEDSQTPFHSNRIGFARNLMNGGGTNIPSIIANRPNLVASNITYDFVDGFIKTDASDAAISSQIATDWNMLSGV